MATLEVYYAALDVEKARKCLQDCQRDLDAALRRRDNALATQARAHEELKRVEGALARNPIPGSQAVLFGNPNAIRKRARELRELLSAAPG